MSQMTRDALIRSITAMSDLARIQEKIIEILSEDYAVMCVNDRKVLNNVELFSETVQRLKPLNEQLKKMKGLST